jgi:hypothetical protein
MTAPSWPQDIAPGCNGRSLRIVAIDVNQLCVIDILGEGTGDGRQVDRVAVRSQLDSIRQTACNVPKELGRTPGVPPSRHARSG